MQQWWQARKTKKQIKFTFIVSILATFYLANINYWQAKEIIKYLEFCVYKQGSQEQAIHNFLLSLYARYKQDEVMRYISSQGKIHRIEKHL